MFKFFSNRKKQTNNETKVHSLIITKLDRIIELLEQQKKETERNNLHFDHVHIEHLENIIFRLDNIEIDQLSGKLSIGNNIYSSEDLTKPLIQKINKEHAKEEAMSDTTSPNETKMMKTSKGYRFKNKF
ncbi:hypothetical protein QNH20_10685 [Neobacillus sp. WH10]|uniref:hypothetical protein n=1 Tax=Neobacillus sp. WH10 TaxID=3047873 RepID=UPI0024C13329|nr:hypothetical protein [Neobacillus sp. WH10]WHY79566.1 hypothetical protein QNH20_10685 [Neobacillus sp. WH10]